MITLVFDKDTGGLITNINGENCYQGIFHCIDEDGKKEIRKMVNQIFFTDLINQRKIETLEYEKVTKEALDKKLNELEEMKRLLEMAEIKKILQWVKFNLLEYFIIFKTSFLASTVLPLGSEPLFIYYLNQDELNKLILLLCATIGNSLGSMTTFFIGWYLPMNKALKKLSINESKFKKVADFLEKKSSLFSFFCFLPIVGDVIAFYYGVNRFRPAHFCLFMTMGKFVRYSLLLALFF